MNPVLSRWNALGRPEAASEMETMGGSRVWAASMADARPIFDRERLHAAAEKSWAVLAAGDWEEAFGAHPQIGDREVAGRERREQAGVEAASADTLAQLADANARYEARFGRVFLVCANGKSAQEMLALCLQRLQNDAQRELTIAMEEQKRITRLRLERWLA